MTWKVSSNLPKAFVSFFILKNLNLQWENRIHCKRTWFSCRVITEIKPFLPSHRTHQNSLATHQCSCKRGQRRLCGFGLGWTGSKRQRAPELLCGKGKKITSHRRGAAEQNHLFLVWAMAEVRPFPVRNWEDTASNPAGSASSSSQVPWAMILILTPPQGLMINRE